MSNLRVLASFGLVGTVGFVVDTAVLYLLKGDLGLYAARAASFLVAAATTWALNRRFTFADRRSSLSTWAEAVTYILLMMIGGAVNYGAYAVLVSSIQLVADFPVIGVAAGSLSGLMVNLLTSRFVLYRHGRVTPRTSGEVASSDKSLRS